MQDSKILPLQKDFVIDNYHIFIQNCQNNLNMTIGRLKITWPTFLLNGS